MTHPNGERADAGFTLLELLIALALLATLTVMLTSAIYGGRQLLTLVEREAAEPSIAVTQAYLRKTIRAMRPLRRSNLSADGPLIDGRSDSLHLVTGYAPDGMHAGDYEAVLKLVPSDKPKSFHLTEVRRLFRPGASNQVLANASPEKSIVLLRDVSGLHVSYFGSQKNLEAPAWARTWQSGLSLPAIVSIEISYTDVDRKIGVPLIVIIEVAQ
jgi:prepilin-type N-terminal cleavage/methylation domain-containing protein